MYTLDEIFMEMIVELDKEILLDLAKKMRKTYNDILIVGADFIEETLAE